MSGNDFGRRCSAWARSLTACPPVVILLWGKVTLPPGCNAACGSRRSWCFRHHLPGDPAPRRRVDVSPLNPRCRPASSRPTGRLADAERDADDSCRDGGGAVGFRRCWQMNGRNLQDRRTWLRAK